MVRLRARYLLLATPVVLAAFAACSGRATLETGDQPGSVGGSLGNVGGTGGSVAAGAGGMPGGAGGAFSSAGTFSIAGAPIVDPNNQPKEECEPVTCTGLGYA